MPFKRLHWRIGLPFAAFVFAGSVVLVAWTWWNIESEERGSFEKLAQSNAKFIMHMRLPASERMARQLSEVLGVGVSFRTKEGFTPPLNELVSPATRHQFEKLAPDGRFHLTGGWESVAVPLEKDTDLVLTKPLVILPQALSHPRMFIIVGGFWFIALGLAWLVTRGLVQPLRHLAAKLPEIEQPEPLDLPEAERGDEIGDVARAFVRTREALRSERNQRVSAERLAVLGRMTAALAHEIQNPVAAIKMHAQLIQNDYESAAIIASEAGRIESLVSQWMFLSKPEPPAMSQVDIKALLVAALAAQGPQMAHTQVKAETNAEDGLLIQGDHRRLTQVFSNLIINAIQAMPRGGELRVAAHRIVGVIELTFADSGKGFSDGALKHFAEFFYSEKEGGMGIGLSVANEIVKAHGGTLQAANQAEGGASVMLRLPL